MSPGGRPKRADSAGARGDRALVVDRAAERVHDPAEQPGTNRHLDHPTGGLDRVAFLDRRRVAEDDRADCLFLEVERHAHQAAGEFEQFGRQGAGQAVDLGDAVADLDHGPHAAGLHAGVERIDRGLDDAGDLVGTNGHRSVIS